jgi:hypothetical protein
LLLLLRLLLLLVNRLILQRIFPNWKSSDKRTKLRRLSPQANYTDRAIAACRRS